MRQKPYYKCYEQTRTNEQTYRWEKKKLNDKNDEDGNKNTNTQTKHIRHDTKHRAQQTETRAGIWHTICLCLPRVYNSHTLFSHTHKHTQQERERKGERLVQRRNAIYFMEIDKCLFLFSVVSSNRERTVPESRVYFGVCRVTSVRLH